ncbi:MAG: hypothetical protein ABH879_11090 [archaeon]
MHISEDLIIKLGKEDMFDLPEMGAGNLVLVLANDYPERQLFVSDGRVAQSDIDFERRGIRRLVSTVYYETPEGHHPHEYVDKTLLEELAQMGHLKDIFSTFGQVSYFWNHRDIGAPQVFFGFNAKYHIGVQISYGEEMFYPTVFIGINPYLGVPENPCLSYAVNSIREVVVGEEAIMAEVSRIPVEIRLHAAERIRRMMK